MIKIQTIHEVVNEVLGSSQKNPWIDGFFDDRYNKYGYDKSRYGIILDFRFEYDSSEGYNIEKFKEDFFVSTHNRKFMEYLNIDTLSFITDKIKEKHSSKYSSGLGSIIFYMTSYDANVYLRSSGQTSRIKLDSFTASELGFDKYDLDEELLRAYLEAFLDGDGEGIEVDDEDMKSLEESKEIYDISDLYFIESSKDFRSLEVASLDELDRYFKLIKNVSEARAFNYHSDYWGEAGDYQKQNVELIKALRPYIGKKVCVDYGDGRMSRYHGYRGKMQGTLLGIAIDKQYNSLGHTKVVFDNMVWLDEGDEG